MGGGTDLAGKSGDPRAMRLEPFIAEVMALLETATTEAVAEAAKPFRDGAGPNEHGFVDYFNQMILDHPLPLP